MRRRATLAGTLAVLALAGCAAPPAVPSLDGCATSARSR